MTLVQRSCFRRKWATDVPRGGQNRSPRRLRIREIARIVAVAVALTIALGASAWQRFLFQGNVDAVDSGRLIRAAQPKTNLVPLLDQYHPATVINLRGGSWNDPWYAAEVVEADKRGLAFYDLPLNASRRPSRKELLLLVDLLDRSAAPILVHCKSGADRTGLATGLYYMTRLNLPPKQAADRAFSIWRGHVPLFGPERLHQPFDEYAIWLESRRLPHTAERFRRWLAVAYRDDDPRANVKPLPSGPRRPRPISSP